MNNHIDVLTLDPKLIKIIKFDMDSYHCVLFNYISYIKSSMNLFIILKFMYIIIPALVFISIECSEAIIVLNISSFYSYYYSACFILFFTHAFRSLRYRST
jgi:hypothetical protein